MIMNLFPSIIMIEEIKITQKHINNLINFISNLEYIPQGRENGNFRSKDTFLNRHSEMKYLLDQRKKLGGFLP